MKITRHQELVEAYHYDMRSPEVEVETDVNVSVTPIDMSHEETFPHETSCVLGLRVTFTVAYETFIVSGAVRQPVVIEDRVITDLADLSQEDLGELMAPLFNIVKRLTYEVTEIALDQPGITLDFNGSMEATEKNDQ